MDALADWHENVPALSGPAIVRTSGWPPTLIAGTIRPPGPADAAAAAGPAPYSGNAASDASAARPPRAVREWISVRDPTLSSFRRIRPEKPALLSKRD
jgi:hypothetical protein